MMKCYFLAIFCFAATSQAAPQKRLTGGSDASISTPNSGWIGSFQRKGACGKWTHVCGCSVLYDAVDTAAHCFPESANINDYRVVFGTDDLTDNSAVIQSLLAYDRHPQFAANTGTGFSFDYIRFTITSQSIGTVVLDALSAGGFPCQVWGWRRTAGSIEPSLLHKVAVTTISRADCKMRVSPLGANISDLDTCVEGNFISEGDSGNPLQCFSNIVGVASWSTTTASGSVTIFTAGELYLG